MRQCENYLRILIQEKPARNQNMFDFHFYKMAIYTKFASLLTQLVLDIVLGFLFMIYLQAQTENVLSMLHYIASGLQMQVLKEQTEWLKEFPGGFHPNPNLSEFISEAILDTLKIIVSAVQMVYEKMCASGTTCDLTSSAIQ